MSAPVNFAASRLRRISDTGAVRAFVAFAGAWAATVFFLWPGRNSLPGAACSAATFFLAPLVFPKAGFTRRPLITPVNWMLFAFSLQLVIVPASVRISGIHSGVMPALPSETATNIALLLDAVGFWAFCASVQTFHGAAPGPAPAPSPAPKSWIPGTKVASGFIVIGLIGLALQFGSLDRLMMYFTDPAAFIGTRFEVAEANGSLQSTAAIFLLPFLGFGWVLLWCRSVDLPMKAGECFRWVRRTGLVVLLGVSFALMNYNRGAFAVALVAIFAVIAKRLPGASLRYWLGAGAVFVALLGAVTMVKRVGTPVITEIADRIDLVDEFQMYGHAPYYDGYFLERSSFGAAPGFGRILICSVMYPVPILGKPFRSSSGTVLYNNILQRRDPPDQIVPFTGELFLDFHVLGVLLGLGCLGWAVARLQARYERASSAAETYIVLFTAIWLGMLPVGSIDVVSQVAVYWAPPVYVYLWLRRRRTTWLPVGRCELAR